MNKIYFIENTVDEFHTAISGYFQTYDQAYEALKNCSNWFMGKGTGYIWETSFGLNAKKTMVYNSNKQGPAK